MFKLNQIFDFFIGVLPFLVLLQAAVYTFYHERKKKESGKMILPNHTEGEKTFPHDRNLIHPSFFRRNGWKPGKTAGRLLG